MSQIVHDREPRDPGVQLHAREPDCKQYQRGAQKRSDLRETLADEAAENAAGTGRQRAV